MKKLLLVSVALSFFVLVACGGEMVTDEFSELPIASEGAPVPELAENMDEELPMDSEDEAQGCSIASWGFYCYGYYSSSSCRNVCSYFGRGIRAFRYTSNSTLCLCR